MKKLLLCLSTFCIFVTLAICLTLPASAETYEGDCGADGDNVKWSLDTDTGKLTISGSGEIYNATWSGYANLITSVEIQEGVTSIGSSAFRSCSSLTSVTIPKGVTSIGDSAFYDCSSLANITIPKGVTSIGAEAFWNCSSLTSVTIPEGVTNISRWTFSGCSSLTSITIPEGVTSISDYAFKDCSSLISITIPDSVTNIVSDAFLNCCIETATVPTIALTCIKNTYLKTVIITSGDSIGNSAFEDCVCLTSITIPESVTSIGNSAFSGCSSLTSITIPEGVTSIGERTFYECSSLTSITIPEGVTSIGERTFYECSSLTSITIPNSITSIGEFAFSGCSSLTSITIPNSIKSIGNSAFYLCSALTSVTIPEGVTSIDKETFAYCYNLKTVRLSNKVIIIKKDAFCNCSSLETIIFCGTEEKWNNVAKVTGWDSGCGNYKVIYHKYNGTSIDESKHTCKCEYCDSSFEADHVWNNGEVTTPATHLEEGVMTYTCKDCGATRTEPIDKTTDHTYGEWSKHNNTQHVKECECGDKQYADHEWDNGAVTTPATHLKEGVMTYTCNDCGATRTEPIDKTPEHTYGEWSKHNNTQHVKECECGDKQYADHEWDNGKVTTPATHLKEGVMTYTCNDCGATRTEPIDKTPAHTYGEWIKHNDTQHVKECACGDKQYADHEWDNGTVTLEPTHIKEGEMTYTCKDCNATRTEPISKTKEHSYSEWVKKDEKQHEKVCACGNKVFVNHTWDNGKITKPATHLEEGVMTYACEDCNATRTEPIAKITEHTYSDWARFDDKQHVKECACGDKQYSDHSFDEGKITTEPTHLKEGVMTYTCKDCGATISEPVEKLKDHEYGEWVKINDQQHERECACGENQCEKHLWDNVAIVERPTDDKDGLKTYTCVCGDSYSEVIPKLGKDPEETKAPDETVKDEKPSNDNSDDSSFTGCGGNVNASVFIVLAFAIVPFSITKKKKEH